ncbi:MAG: hypothetical protein ACI85Q_002239 [Salibacteraceae bacterium]|jgi:hypothetical protein
MKALFSLLLGFIAIGLNTLASDPAKTNEYFICHFNSEVTKSELTELTQQGFKIMEKDSTATVVYVISKTSNAFFTAALKNKMEMLIKVDQYGNRVQVKTRIEEQNSLEFFKLFFNFI